MAKRTVLLLTCLVVLLAAPARAEASYDIGMGDQKLGMWHDARFQALGIRHVRLIVAYDLVLKGDFSRYDAWLHNARSRGAHVLIAFNHSTKSHTRLPSLAEYRRVVQAIRTRYPFVTTLSAWNEANHWTQPTHRNPRRAAQYYNLLRAECPRCRIVAADVLDQRGMDAWLKTFKRYARKPKLWGLHNYGDSNHLRPVRKSGTARFLKLVRGEVWLTETGGIVRFGRTRTFRGGRAAEARAARATRHTFALARSSRRIKRVYLYHWDSDPVFDTWDSGLIDNQGRARPALEVLRDEVNRERRRRQLPLVGRFSSASPGLVSAP